MFIDTKPYWFNKKSLSYVEKHYGAKHIGYWCIKDKRGNWSEIPVDVFYQPNPDISKGHSHYFGIYYAGLENETLLITNAESAFSEKIIGVLGNYEEVLVSRYRHDYISRDGVMVDGGRDYFKHSIPATLVEVSVNNGTFSFEKVND